MGRPTRRLTWLIALSVVATACREDATAPEVDLRAEAEDADAALVSAIEDITRRFGLIHPGSLAGAGETDEDPAFGNALFAEAFGGPESPEVGLDVASDPALLTLPDQARIYSVMAVWGRIRPGPSAEWTRVRWDPALQVAEDDVVRVRRSLLFERGDRVHPQERRNLVTMTSVTGPHVDGVAAQVAIVPPAAAAAEDPTAPTRVAGDFLAFRSLPYSVRIPAAELGGLRVAQVIDDAGNGVLLAAVRRAPSSCAVGFMNGRWARTSERGGVFGGAWVQENGRRGGHLAGRWGVTERGERVFRGKLVNRQGEFLAFMAGRYRGGVYEGEIHGRGGVLLGHVGGRYTGEDGRGHFLGGWRQACETD